MKIVNTCTNQPADSVLAALRFALRHLRREWEYFDAGRLVVKVKNSNGHSRGMAFHNVQTREDRAEGYRWLITMGFSAGVLTRKFSYKFETRNTFETVLYVAAHELQHMADIQLRKKPSEAAANSWARHTIIQWRKETAGIVEGE